jgi:diaminopimelate epimerase
MGAPIFEPHQIPFDADKLSSRQDHQITLYELPLKEGKVWIAPVSMGNPHAVTLVDQVATADVATLGPQIENNSHFPKRVNAGFMEVVGRHEIKLRVYERGSGETLACGTGACAAVVSGISRGLLDSPVTVHTKGGALTIEWNGKRTDHVLMTGPAETVFEGEVQIV